MTPMMQQYRQIKARHEDAILFFRMGDFYEMFEQDAQEVAGILEVALTSRDKKSKNPIPMCGVPHHAAEQYIRKLTRRGYKVAICEQTEDPRLAKGVVKREVVRVVTPGTEFQHENSENGARNFLVSLYANRGECAVAFCDLSLGTLETTLTPNVSWLRDSLLDSAIREIIVPDNLDSAYVDVIQNMRGQLNIRTVDGSSIATLESQFLDFYNVSSLHALGLTQQPLEVAAASVLLNYVKETQICVADHVRSPRSLKCNDAMIVDPNTRKNLEIVESIQGGKERTLFAVLDHCATAMGQRKLRAWLEYPLLDPSVIQARQQSVGVLIDDFDLNIKLRQNLKEICDIDRILGRIAFGRFDPRHADHLLGTLVTVPIVKGMLKDKRGAINTLVDAIPDVSSLIMVLQTRLADEPPNSLSEGGVVRKGYNDELDELREVRSQAKQYLINLEKRERERSQIGSLRVKFNKVFGYFIEVTKANLDRVPEDYERKQTLVNCERFVTQELKEFENKILTASERIADLETEIFEEIKQAISEAKPMLQALADVLAQLDVLHSFATAAGRFDYVCPEIVDDTSFQIIEGRHPVVERYLEGERFIPNDLGLDAESRQVMLLTGPNMSGKSTLLRQTCLICLMAQVGSFVPAKSARIGIVDRIFTRIGASDDISRGRSTFMVEMEETANILRNATSRSLLVLDEVGRGTSTFDGMSIAKAAIEYIHDEIKARALFATHFHELTALSDTHKRLFNMHIEVNEYQGKVSFLHRLEEGPIAKSYGLTVAELAGLPPVVISRAAEILGDLEARSSRERKHGQADQLQLTLLTKESDPVSEKLCALNLETITPLELVTIIDQLQKEARKSLKS